MSVSPLNIELVPSSNDGPEANNLNSSSSSLTDAAASVYNDGNTSNSVAEGSKTEIKTDKSNGDAETSQTSILNHQTFPSKLDTSVEEESNNATEESSKSDLEPDKTLAKKQEDKYPERRSLPSRKARVKATTMLSAFLTSGSSKNIEDIRSVEVEKKAVKRNSSEYSTACEEPQKRVFVSEELRTEHDAKTSVAASEESQEHAIELEKIGTGGNTNSSEATKEMKFYSDIHESVPKNANNTLIAVNDAQSLNGSAKIPVKGDISKVKESSNQIRKFCVSKSSTISQKVVSILSRTRKPNVSETTSSDSSATFEPASGSPNWRKKSTQIGKCVEPKKKSQLHRRGIKMISRAVCTQTEYSSLAKPHILNIIDSNEKLKSLSGFPSFDVLDHITDATLKLVTKNQAMISELGPCLREWIILTCFKFLLNIEVEPLAVLFQLDILECEQIVQKTSRFLRKSLVLPSCQSFVCDIPLSVLNGIADCTDNQADNPR